MKLHKKYNQAILYLQYMNNICVLQSNMNELSGAKYVKQSKKHECGRFIRKKANHMDYVHYKFT